ncbi:MAG: hypothetical protein AB8B97_25435 [Granulosicoccus sp.]
MNISRRALLCGTAAVAATAFFGVPGRAVASVEDVDRMIAEFGGGAESQEGGHCN